MRLDFAGFEVLADFRLETSFDALIRLKLDGPRLPETMPMMVSVRFVVSDDSASVDAGSGPTIAKPS